MVGFIDTLDRFKKEKEYEDDLVKSLMGSFVSYLKGISDLKAKDEVIVRDKLMRIATDSERHSQLFSALIKMVTENGDNNY